MRRALLCLALLLLRAPIAFADDAPSALRQLHALNSVADAGVTIQEYERRVLDAKIVVDRYLAKADPDVRRRAAITRAMRLYVEAGNSWRYSITKSNPPNLGPEGCPPVRDFFVYVIRDGGAKVGAMQYFELIQASAKIAVPLYWSCASAWTRTAEGGPDPTWPSNPFPPAPPASAPAPPLREGAHEAQRRYQCQVLGGSACDGIEQVTPQTPR